MREVNFNLRLTTEFIVVGSLRLASTSLQSRVMVVLFRGHVTALPPLDDGVVAGWQVVAALIMFQHDITNLLISPLLHRFLP